MDAVHGSGVGTLLAWLESSASYERALQLSRGLSPTELADVLETVADALKVTGNGAALMQAAAENIRELLAEREDGGGGDRAPADDDEDFCGAPVGEIGRCLKQQGHAGDHSAVIETRVQQLQQLPEVG